MALNNFFAKLASGENQPKETFFALEISQDHVKSAVWVVEEGKTQVLKVGTIEEWQENEEESFLKSADETISSASEGIIPEPKGILFGLPEDWVENESIAAERKHLLRHICDKLDLKPLGFVVTLEALIQYFKAQQGTPLNAILIRFTETDLLVSLVKMGKTMGTETVGKTEDLVADVKEGLARFNEDSLPPRMILYDGLTDFEEPKQQLLSFDWQKELPFLHFPKIESLSRETSVRAVAIAGGGEVARSLGLEVLETSVNETEELSKKIEKKEPGKPEEEPLATQLPPPTEIATVEKKEPSLPSAEAFGFVENQDILQVNKEELEKEAVETEDRKQIRQLADGGQKTEGEKREWRIKGEVEDMAAPATAEKLDKKEELEPVIIPESKESHQALRNHWLFLQSLTGKLAILPSFVGHFLGSRRFRLPLPNFLGKIGFIILIFIFLMLGGFAFYWYAPRAEVVIYTTPQVLEKELTIHADTKVKDFDINQAVMPATTQTIDNDGKLTESATGKKLVGDKAKGSLTISNKTDSTKTFTKGTILVGPNNLSFELTDDVKIASRSSTITSDGEKITYGKGQVNVVASDIGPEYNLSGGTEFSFKDYGTSKYSAKTDSGLSGGSSREIRAVSENDQKNLLQKLTDQLKADAQNKLQTQAGQDKIVLESGMSVETVKKSFDKKVGDESDQETLSLSLRLTALTLSRNDLNTFLLKALSGSLTNDFQLKTEDIKTDIQDVTVDQEKATIKLVARAKLLPVYDLEAVRDNLVGKYPPLVQSYLATLPNFAKADIKIVPKLPGKLGTLPRLKDKITIKVETQE
ncbi:hypothetical protein A2160_00815 [Candidatus Beckwithbacteria bacterium RBG_13_42_9]|uniref:Baseplate protein J-like domain-containing protein n=1 Tax=Candidatus Beckwithbacteria bacterium RBG_13_42_9 TaxID=1797457 RepID=A0A1F5E3F3_9BACT|nr:MAG: hypothetical protein A2160_00815 [Candidatus Beckwithbacteria bacterium RBG_13_42_9]